MAMGTDKFYLSLLGRSLAMTHVIDAVLDSFSNLFRSHRYHPLEKICSVFLFTVGLSLRKWRRELGGSITMRTRRSWSA